MRVTVGGMEILNGMATPVMNQAIDAFKDVTAHSTLLTVVQQAVPAIAPINIDHIAHILIQLGQTVLLGTSGVIVVVCGILMVVGSKREGWKRVMAIIQGMGVGLVGPTIVTLVAGLFIGLSKIIV